MVNPAPKFYNCLISKSGAGAFYGGTNADQYTAQYNLTDYSLPSSASISNNIRTSDPGFINQNVPAGDDGIYATADDGLKPLSNSPAVNAGFN